MNEIQRGIFRRVSTWSEKSEKCSGEEFSAQPKKIIVEEFFVEEFFDEECCDE
jgi:hypothetical protein